MGGTASALERELACPASAVLAPRVYETGEAAERGTELHRFVRSVVAGTPRQLALAAIPTDTSEKWKETAEGIDFAILCGGLVDVRSEVSYRIDAANDTARELGVNLGRRYPVRAALEFDGTNDVEGRRPLSGGWVVIDVKSGHHDYVTRCETNPQMRFHARALMLVHDVDQVEARVAFIGEGGEINFDDHTFTRLELDLFGDELVAGQERIAKAEGVYRDGGKLEVYAGSHCRYCPAKDVCPRHTALAHSMLTDLRDAHAKWGQLTDEEKAKVTLMAYEARDLSERIVESMKALAQTNPIPLPGGKILKDTGSGVRIVNVTKSRRRVA